MPLHHRTAATGRRSDQVLLEHAPDLRLLQSPRRDGRRLRVSQRHCAELLLGEGKRKHTSYWNMRRAVDNSGQCKWLVRMLCVDMYTLDNRVE